MTFGIPHGFMLYTFVTIIILIINAWFASTELPKNSTVSNLNNPTIILWINIIYIFISILVLLYLFYLVAFTTTVPGPGSTTVFVTSPSPAVQVPANPGVSTVVTPSHSVVTPSVVTPSVVPSSVIYRP